MAKGSHSTWDGFHGPRVCAVCGEACAISGRNARGLWIDIGRQRVAHMDCALGDREKWWEP